MLHISTSFPLHMLFAHQRAMNEVRASRFSMYHAQRMDIEELKTFLRIRTLALRTSINFLILIINR